MKRNFKKALSLMLVLGCTAALRADAPSSGQSSGSLPPANPPAAPAAQSCGGGCDSGHGCCDTGRGCCDNNHGCLDSGCNDPCCQGGGVIVGAEWHILRPVINDNRAFTLTN